ncbi:FHL2 [Mytilus edulis]|uniref:FHL2 n=1 Tax=Mytilus edulis TaxID=6550 RepID=A0A8S3T7U8_MYTED|nr:FHL2 [Mytilus edulis]
MWQRHPIHLRTSEILSCLHVTSDVFYLEAHLGGCIYPYTRDTRRVSSQDIWRGSISLYTCGTRRVHLRTSGRVHISCYMWYQTCFISGHLGGCIYPAIHVTPDVFHPRTSGRIAYILLYMSTRRVSSQKSGECIYPATDMWHQTCFISGHLGGCIYPAFTCGLLPRRVSFQDILEVHISCYTCGTRRVSSQEGEITCYGNQTAYILLYMWHQTCFISCYTGHPTYGRVHLSCYTCGTRRVSSQDIWEGAYIPKSICMPDVHLRTWEGACGTRRVSSQDIWEGAYILLYMWNQTCFISGHLGGCISCYTCGTRRVSFQDILEGAYILLTCGTRRVSSRTSGEGFISAYMHMSCYTCGTRRFHLRTSGRGAYILPSTRRVSSPGHVAPDVFHLRTSGRVHISCYTRDTRRVSSQDIWEDAYILLYT